MGTNIIVLLGGIYLLSTVISITLEQSGKTMFSKNLDLIATLVGLLMIVTTLSKLIIEVKTVFNLY
jgi:hypothetical protein